MKDRMTVTGSGSNGSFSYDIIWRDSFSDLAAQIRQIPGLAPKRICVVTDSHVADLYMADVIRELASLHVETEHWIFQAGEESKTLSEVTGLYKFLIRCHFDRRDLLIALGGGVAGDLTGFSAATFLRGIDFIQVPTTLLAQVDSSIGGKTGVDLDSFKNMVGAFYQPRLVFMNTKVLSTLPDEQFASGMGEVIKTALLGDADLYRFLRTGQERILRRDPETMTYIIHACCRVKAEIVSRDPTEKGDRILLNLGHTLGHAVEKCSQYTLPHGHCVGLGLAAAAEMSAQRGLIPDALCRQIRELLQAYDLPVSVGGMTAEELLQASRSDKKMAGGQIRFILLRGTGHAYADNTVTDAEMISAAETILSEGR